MRYEELSTLAASYPPCAKDALFELAQRYRLGTDISNEQLDNIA